VQYTRTLYTPKPTNIAELKTALLQYGMICHRSSLKRQPCDFERDFDFVLLQLANSLNTPRGQLTFITEAFEVLTKKLCEVWFVIKYDLL